MVFYAFLAGGFFGAAALQGSRRRIDGAGVDRERRPETEEPNALD
jgi:hypothetical protein